jgi:2-polyprenyl-3-methyl-5-hydroxy-6-metoxy-1,4-benzoquinol methylase
MLSRTLEPEIMDNDQDAIEYNQMDHSTVNQAFVTDLLVFAEQIFDQSGRIGRVAPPPAGAGGNGDREDGCDDWDFDYGPQAGSCRFGLGDVLDVGTGTALIPVELCRRHPFCRIMATDMATSMLNLAVYNVAVAGFDSRITLNQVDAKKMIFRDQYFDVVISNSIIHHIPQPLEVFREMDRTLRPGGILFVRDLLRPADLSTLNSLVETHAGHETEYSRKLFSDSLHAALTLAEVREMLGSLGYPAEAVVQSSDRHWTLAARKPIPA